MATEGAGEERSLGRLPRPRAAGHDSARPTAQRHSPLLTSSHLTPFTQKANLTGRPRPPRAERSKGQCGGLLDSATAQTRRKRPRQVNNISTLSYPSLSFIFSCILIGGAIVDIGSCMLKTLRPVKTMIAKKKKRLGDLNPGEVRMAVHR